MAVMFAFAETRGGEVRKVAFEAVTAARHAADATGGGEVHALVLGAPAFTYHVEGFGPHIPDGASLVHLTDDPSNAAWAAAGLSRPV